MAFALIIEASMSNLSSELSSQEYSPLKSDIECWRSDWKICGSLINIRSGWVRSLNFLRLYRFRFMPSIFQVSEVSCTEVGLEFLGGSCVELAETLLVDDADGTPDWLIPLDKDAGFLGFICTDGNIVAPTDLVGLLDLTSLNVVEVQTQVHQWKLMMSLHCPQCHLQHLQW